MKVLAIIPARGGSKGIPKKNIVPLGGKPLIAWTIEASKGSKYINRTFVSSDSDEILAVSQECGAETIKRPGEISGDDSPFELLIMHVLENLKNKESYSPDLIVYLQPTSPLRTSADIDDAIAHMLSKKGEALISLFELDNKYLKAFVVNEKGYITGAINNRYPFINRQDLPKLFMPNGAIYIIKKEIFMKTKQLFSKKTIPFIMSKEKSIDIDSNEGLANAKNLLKSSIIR